MPQPLKTDHWQVQLPDGWKALSGPDAATLYSPSGVGMLQIFISLDEAYDGVGAGQDFQGRLVGKYYAGTVYQGTYQRGWTLSCLGRRLSAIYTCAAANADIEVEQVDQIVQSLDEVDGASA